MSQFESDSKLVCVFYTLIRDHLPIGVIEKIVKESENLLDSENDKPTITYSNKYLAEYAKSIEERLIKKG